MIKVTEEVLEKIRQSGGKVVPITLAELFAKAEPTDLRPKQNK